MNSESKHGHPQLMVGFGFDEGSLCSHALKSPLLKVEVRMFCKECHALLVRECYMPKMMFDMHPIIEGVQMIVRKEIA